MRGIRAWDALMGYAQGAWDRRGGEWDARMGYAEGAYGIRGGRVEYGRDGGDLEEFGALEAAVAVFVDGLERMEEAERARCRKGARKPRKQEGKRKTQSWLACSSDNIERSREDTEREKSVLTEDGGEEEREKERGSRACLRISSSVSVRLSLCCAVSISLSSLSSSILPAQNTRLSIARRMGGASACSFYRMRTTAASAYARV